MTPPPEMTVAERDRETLGHIAAAQESVQAALRSMPNRIESVFGAGDARVLSHVERDLSVLLMVQTEIEGEKRDPN